MASIGRTNVPLRSQWSLCALILCSVPIFVNGGKEKRQIFREQVLPALGGKIPEEAFRTDRLALNRLNKEGITVPDGVLLDARGVHKHPQSDPSMPEVLKLYPRPEGRYVSAEGRYHYERPKSVDTTYVLQRPFLPSSSQGQAEERVRSAATAAVYQPIVRTLLLPQRVRFPFAWNVVELPWTAITYGYPEDYVLNDNALLRDGYFSQHHGRHLRYVRPRAERERLGLRAVNAHGHQVHSAAYADIESNCRVSMAVTRQSAANLGPR